MENKSSELEFSSLQRQVISEKLESLRRCLVRVEEKAKLSFEAFEKDLDAQDVVVLNLERAVQLCVATASFIVAHFNLSAPSTMADCFKSLRAEGILSEDLEVRMIKVTGFRNLAVHEYAELDLKIVYAIATQHLDDFKRFANSVTL